MHYEAAEGIPDIQESNETTTKTLKQERKQYLDYSLRLQDSHKIDYFSTLIVRV